MTSLVYSTGTVSVSNGSATVTGAGSAWATALVTGGVFSCGGLAVPIASVNSDTSLTLAYAWPGSDDVGAAYAIARETSEATRAAWTNDRLATVITRLSLVGIHPDGSGTLEERDALDPVPANKFLWLHAEPGFPLTFYRKVSSGWEGPFPVEGSDGDPGPVGPAAVLNWITAGWITATDYEVNDGLAHNGSSYRAYTAHTSGTTTEPGIGGDWEDAWQVTAAAGGDGEDGTDGVSFVWRGAYSGATAYAADDVVRDNGSSWIALQATTGNAPPVFPATTNAFWELHAAKGTDGSGTGDMVGPASSTALRVAVFANTTGKQLADGGILLADLATQSFVTSAINVIKGGVSAAFDTLSEIATDLGLKMVKSANLADVADAATAFNNIKQAASDAVTGVVEKATDAEFRAATADKYLSADLALSAMGWVAITAGATPAIDHAAGVNRTITHSANATMGAPSNAKLGWPLNIDITPGAFTTSWHANYKFGSGGAPSITARRIVHFICRDASTFVFLGTSEPN